MQTVQRLCFVTRLGNTFLKDCYEKAEFVEERDISLLVDQAFITILTELKHLSIRVEVTIPTHLIHHEIFLIFELSKDHSEQREQFRQPIDVRVVWKVTIENLIVRSAQIVALKDVNYLEHEYTASLGIDSLLLYLVTGDVCQKLFFSLQINPDLIKYLIRAEQVVDADLESQKLLALRLDVVAFVKYNN